MLEPSMTTTDPIRVLVADDNADFRRGLRALLAAVQDVLIVSEAATGDEAAAQATATQPDVVLMDLSMPALNGIEATRRIVSASPHIAVLMFTMFEDDESVLAAMRAGARGYLLKGSSRREISRAIQVAAEGGVIFGPGVARRALEQFSSTSGPQTDLFPQLTEREREVLTLIADGLSNAAIATRLTLSPKTVRNHVYSLYGKLQVQSRPEAIVHAREAGLGRRPQPPP
jgi:DNA-binding NarL/FixJ family response regulator